MGSGWTAVSWTRSWTGPLPRPSQRPHRLPRRLPLPPPQYQDRDYRPQPSYDQRGYDRGGQGHRKPKRKEHWLSELFD